MRLTAAGDGVQQDLPGYRGRTGDPHYRARRTLHTGADLLTERQRLTALFGVDEHVPGRGDLGRLLAHGRRLPRTWPDEASSDHEEGD
jgi:hypothetical protein